MSMFLVPSKFLSLITLCLSFQRLFRFKQCGIDECEKYKLRCGQWVVRHFLEAKRSSKFFKQLVAVSANAKAWKAVNKSQKSVQMRK